MKSIYQWIKQFALELPKKADINWVKDNYKTVNELKSTFVTVNSNNRNIEWDEILNKPISFTPTVTTEIAGTSITEGQIVRVDKNGKLITNDLLKAVRVAGTSQDIATLASEPITLKEVFSNWQKISCNSNGTDKNGTDSTQVTARSCYYYDDATKSIVCPNNSDPFTAFISNETYTPDYSIKYRLKGRDGDDDGLCFVAGFMTDKNGEFHTLTVWRMGDDETATADPISDFSISSHGARYAICYDIYSAWIGNSPKGKVLARTVAPKKTAWNTNTCLCQVTKTSTKITAKTADVNSTDLKYTIEFTLPATKPSDWTQEMYDNIKYMMQNPSNIGFGTQSNPCSFSIVEQTGSITSISVYDITTGNKITYLNGKKASEKKDSNVITPGCFLYSILTKKLFYVKDSKTIYPIVL